MKNVPQGLNFMLWHPDRRRAFTSETGYPITPLFEYLVKIKISIKMTGYSGMKSVDDRYSLSNIINVLIWYLNIGVKLTIFSTCHDVVETYTDA